ncbi:MAG: substrate-binding domain-containing protein [Hylemonella sp.]
MKIELSCISSMATRLLLQELLKDYPAAGGPAVSLEAVGGVLAAKRVQAGEPFDVVVLDAEVIGRMIDAGQVLAGSKVDLVLSGVAVAVRNGASQPDIASEQSVKQAVLAARSICYSTGPSGLALARLFERWGIAEQIKDRIVTAPPGIPVGALVASGEAELGFQQLSELLPIEGITVLGPLPDAIQVITTFSGGVCANSQQVEAARTLLAYLSSPTTAAVKKRLGMVPA